MRSGFFGTRCPFWRFWTLSGACHFFLFFLRQGFNIFALSRSESEHTTTTGQPSQSRNGGDIRLINHQQSTFLPLPLYVNYRLLLPWYHLGALIRKLSRDLNHQRSYLNLNFGHRIWNFYCGDFFFLGYTSNLDGPLIYKSLYATFQFFTCFRIGEIIFATDMVF